MSADARKVRPQAGGSVGVTIRDGSILGEPLALGLMKSITGDFLGQVGSLLVVIGAGLVTLRRGMGHLRRLGSLQCCRPGPNRGGAGTFHSF